MKPFYELTTRGRTRRLRTLATAALTAYPFTVKRLRPLQNGWNASFRVDMARADGGEQERAVLRINMPDIHGPETIRSEMMWVSALAEDGQIPVAMPFRTKEGDWLTTAQVPGVPEPRHCVLFRWLPGPDLAGRITPGNYVELGTLMARMHEQAARWSPPADFAIPTANTVFNPIDPQVLLDPEHRHLLPAEQWPIYEEAVKQVADELARLYDTGHDTGDGAGLRVLHYDLHPWNVKVQRGTLVPFDFEDLTWGYPVQDVALSLYYVSQRDDFDELRAAFAEGYRQVLPWPETYAGQIELHMVRRLLDFANYYAVTTDPAMRDEASGYLGQGVDRIRRWLKCLALCLRK